MHTPGHTSNHMCWAFAEEGVLFPGDHVMGWSTTVVSPPDGDMTAYMDSLRKVAGRADAHVLADPRPGHHRSRSATSTPSSSTAWSASSRCSTPCAVGSTEIPAIVAVLYANVDEKLHKPAGRSVLSHLVKLVDEGTVVVTDGDRPRLKSHYGRLTPTVGSASAAMSSSRADSISVVVIGLTRQIR